MYIGCVGQLGPETGMDEKMRQSCGDSEQRKI